MLQFSPVKNSVFSDLLNSYARRSCTRKHGPCQRTRRHTGKTGLSTSRNGISQVCVCVGGSTPKSTRGARGSLWVNVAFYFATTQQCNVKWQLLNPCSAEKALVCVDALLCLFMHLEFGETKNVGKEDSGRLRAWSEDTRREYSIIVRHKFGRNCQKYTVKGPKEPSFLCSTTLVKHRSSGAICSVRVQQIRSEEFGETSE